MSHIRHIRQKLESDEDSFDYIENIRGVGYRFKKIIRTEVKIIWCRDRIVRIICIISLLFRHRESISARFHFIADYGNPDAFSLIYSMKYLLAIGSAFFSFVTSPIFLVITGLIGKMAI